MKYSFWSIISQVFFSILALKYSNAGIHQRRLLHDLFKDHDPLERPTKNEEDTLLVDVGLAIQQIVDVDEKKQAIIFSGWLDMAWTDYNFIWDPKDYGNITKLRISSTKVWIPDLLLYNSVDSFDSTAKVNVIIRHNGSVSYTPPGMFRSTCIIRVDDFPFDRQVCELKFGSWTYDETSVFVTNKSYNGQVDAYIKNGEWFLEDIKSYSESISYECCPADKFPFVMFEIYIRRRPLYFIFNLIFPCLLMSLMNLLGFLLPPESSEKVGLEVTVLLSIIMFSNFISETIPETSLSVSRIAMYFTTVMMFSTLSIIANIMVLVFHHKNVKLHREMPRWVDYYICERLASIIGLKCPLKPSIFEKRWVEIDKNYRNEVDDYYEECEILPVLSKREETNFNSHSSKNNKSTLLNEQLLSFQHVTDCLKSLREDIILYSQIMNSNNNTRKRKSESPRADSNDQHVLKRQINLIEKELNLIVRKMREEDEYEMKSLKWKFAAMVIDRFCLILFSISTILSISLILLTCENLYKSSDPSPKF